MKRLLFAVILSASCMLVADAQPVSWTDKAATKPLSPAELIVEKLNPATTVKNQQQTGTCWCFSGTSFVESQFLQTKGNAALDLSEMFTVRNIYKEKAKNYFLRQGHAQLGEGGLGHDVIRAISLYGAVPESVFTGLPEGQKYLNHAKLMKDMQAYLDSEIALGMKGDADNEMTRDAAVDNILNKYIGNPPAQFSYEGMSYTPLTFAKDYLKFNAADYVNITSFTDHAFYESFIISVPDNFSNGAYYNLPLDEMTDVVKTALNKGYTVLWDADVSNNGFNQDAGVALNVPKGVAIKAANAFTTEEAEATPAIRQKLYEELVTQDDHLMHIIGLEKNKEGKAFFLVKNSWGEVGPYKGFINVSEPYFDINTISLVVPKAAITKAELEKLHIK